MWSAMSLISSNICWKKLCTLFLCFAVWNRKVLLWTRSGGVGLRQIILNFSSLWNQELGVDYLNFAVCRNLYKYCEKLKLRKPPEVKETCSLVLKEYDATSYYANTNAQFHFLHQKNTNRDHYVFSRGWGRENPFTIQSCKMWKDHSRQWSRWYRRYL